MSNANNFSWKCPGGIINGNLSNITPPTPKNGILYQMGGSASPDAYAFPGYSNNGDFLKVDIISGNAVYYYNASRTFIWGKTANDISTGHDYVIALYFSSIDDKYYVVTFDTLLSKIRLSSLNKTDGTPTNLSAELTPYGSAPTITFGSAGITQLGSSDLLLLVSSVTDEGLMIQFTNTGTVVSSTAIIQSGRDMFLANGRQVSITYRSNDGTILAGMQNTSQGNDLFFVAKGGNFRIFANNVISILNGNLLIGWDGYVAAIANYNNFMSKNVSRFFIQSDFDRWLNDVCTMIGI